MSGFYTHTPTLSGGGGGGEVVVVVVVVCVYVCVCVCVYFRVSKQIAHTSVPLTVPNSSTSMLRLWFCQRTVKNPTQL